MATPTSSNGLNTSGSSAVRVQIGREQNVEQLGQKPVADNPSTSTMGVNSQVGPVRTVQTDYKDLVRGIDYRPQPGDVAKSSLDKASDNGGPRQSVGQFALSGKTPAAPAPASFIGAEGSDQN